MVYVWLLDELRQEVQTAVLAAVLARAVGAEVEVPSWPAVRAGFDARLAAEPEPESRHMVLLRAFGMRG